MPLLIKGPNTDSVVGLHEPHRQTDHLTDSELVEEHQAAAH